MTTVIGSSCAVRGFATRPSSMNSLRSASRVCFSMNVRSGGVPRLTASITVTLPAMAGSTASAEICVATGAMMNMVRKSASPMRIWFDGISCVPSA